MTWRALYCLGGQELPAKRELDSLKIEAFCPYERFKRHKSVRGTVQIRWIDSALFPNYIFANTDSYLSLDSVKGILAVVKVGARPLAVPDAIISAMRALAEPDGLARREDLTRNSYHFRAREGDRFTFKQRSPLHGLIGQIQSLAKLDESGELTAWVELLGRKTEVRLNFSEVNKILEGTPATA